MPKKVIQQPKKIEEAPYVPEILATNRGEQEQHMQTNIGYKLEYLKTENDQLKQELQQNLKTINSNKCVIAMMLDHQEKILSKGNNVVEQSQNNIIKELNNNIALLQEQSKTAKKQIE